MAPTWSCEIDMDDRSVWDVLDGCNAVHERRSGFLRTLLVVALVGTTVKLMAPATPIVVDHFAQSGLRTALQSKCPFLLTTATLKQ